MTELMKKAIAKIDAEGEKGGHYEKYMAQWIIENIITDDDSAKRILKDEKKLDDCFYKMVEIAEKQKEKVTDPKTGKPKPGCFVGAVTPEQIFSTIREYYEVEEKAASSNIISLDLADLL